MKKYQIEIGQILREWRGWEGWREVFEADECATFTNEADYKKEVKRFKKSGLKVYYQDDHETLFIY